MRSAWAIASLVILLLAALFAVPGVRAEIVRFFQVGCVSFPQLHLTGLRRLKGH
jgi:hypothetical protein